jgi:hypothetical protein
MRHFTQPLRGRNVFIVDGVASEDEPTATYNADGTLNETAAERIQRVFWGGHAAEPVTAEEEVILEAAGFTVDD